MSVYPRFAEAIKDGREKVECGKCPLADDVAVVCLYATELLQSAP